MKSQKGVKRRDGNVIGIARKMTADKQMCTGIATS
jgi:hypothetical protein